MGWYKCNKTNLQDPWKIVMNFCKIVIDITHGDRMEASEYPYLSWYLVLYVVINLQNDTRNVSFIGMI